MYAQMRAEVRNILAEYMPLEEMPSTPIDGHSKSTCSFVWLIGLVRFLQAVLSSCRGGAAGARIRIDRDIKCDIG